MYRCFCRGWNSPDAPSTSGSLHTDELNPKEIQRWSQNTTSNKWHSIKMYAFSCLNAKDLKKIDDMCVVVSDNNTIIPRASISSTFVITVSWVSRYVLAIIQHPCYYFLFLCYVTMGLHLKTGERLAHQYQERWELTLANALSLNLFIYNWENLISSTILGNTYWFWCWFCHP